MQTSILLLAFVFALTNARTILWTNAGGNPLWNNAGNWDCQCLPTINDDVVIDIQAIPGNVQIGGVTAPALANSLTVGGTSRFGQVLTINGPLTIGGGGSKLATNGKIIFQAGNTAPFINGGVFNIEGNGFVYYSGTLSGSGSFVWSASAALNLTGAASKTIQTTVIVNGKVITDTTSGTNVDVQMGGNFITAGSFIATKSLSVIVDNSSFFSVKGNLAFTGAVLDFQGSGFSISSWSIGTGSATIDNGISSGTLKLGGGSVILVGGPNDQRNFNSITGTGAIYNFGGVNNFNSVSITTFNVTGGNTSVNSGNFGTLTIRGGFLMGNKISASTAVLESGFLTGGVTLSTTKLRLKGVISLVDDGTTLVIQGFSSTGSVVSSSQLTLSGSSSFQVAAGATFTQNAPLQIVSSTPKATSYFLVNGAVKSGSNFTISGIPITGSGSFTLYSTAFWSLTNVAFSANSLNLQGNLNIAVGTFSANTVSGSGILVADPNSFVAGSLSLNSFTLTSGTVQAANVSLTTLNLYNGNFGISSSGKITTFNFLGGKFFGVSSTTARIPVSVGTIVISGAGAQTLNNVDITTTAVLLDCALSNSCQLITTNTDIQTA